MLTSTGEMYQATFQRVTNPDVVVRAVSANTPTRVRNVAGVEYKALPHSSPPGAPPINLPMNLSSVAGNLYYLSVQIPTFTLTGSFTASGSDLVPVFGGTSQQQGVIGMAPVFIFPADVHVTVGVIAKWLPEYKRYFWQKTFFFCRKAGQPGDFLLPLPNVYDYGAMCMGSRYELNTITLSRMMTEVLERIRVSPWNSDLLSHRGEAAQRCFRCNADGSPKPVPGDDLIAGLTAFANPDIAHFQP